MQPTQNHVTGPPAVQSHPCDRALPCVSSVLSDAAAYVAEYGMYVPSGPRDNYHWSRHPTHPPASDVGAIALVIYGHPVPLPEPDGSARYSLFRKAINAWVDWLDEYYGEGSEPHDSL